MRVVIETFYDDNGVDIGELVIESDELSYKVVQYSKPNKDGKRHASSIRHFITEGGALREIKRRKLKESKATTVEQLLEGLGDIDAYIREKTALVVAAREPRVKRTRAKPEEVPIEII
jgi:hypothetical protein